MSSSLSDTDLAAAAAVASGKDLALVFITADSGESANVEGTDNSEVIRSRMLTVIFQEIRATETTCKHGMAE